MGRILELCGHRLGGTVQPVSPPKGNAGNCWSGSNSQGSTESLEGSIRGIRGLQQRLGAALLQQQRLRQGAAGVPMDEPAVSRRRNWRLLLGRGRSEEETLPNHTDITFLCGVSRDYWFTGPHLQDRGPV